MGKAILSQGHHEHCGREDVPWDIGATAIMVSNHGGRRSSNGSRSPLDQLAEIVDAVGDRDDASL